MAYCTAADLYLYGLPRGALASSGRLISSVSTSADTFELDAHGLSTDAQVHFRVVGGGTLPSPITPYTTYYAIVVDDWRFQISSSAGGSAVNISTTGSTFAVYTSLPVADVITKISRSIDDMLPAHVVPLSDPVPEIIRVTTAELAAAELLAMTGGQSESLALVYDRAMQRLARWSRHAPIRGTDAPPSAQRAATAVASTRVTSPWSTYGGIG